MATRGRLAAIWLSRDHANTRRSQLIPVLREHPKVPLIHSKAVSSPTVEVWFGGNVHRSGGHHHTLRLERNNSWRPLDFRKVSILFNRLSMIGRDQFCGSAATAFSVILSLVGCEKAL